MTGSPKEQGILTLAGTSKLGLALSVFRNESPNVIFIGIRAIHEVVLHEPGGNVKSI